MTFPATSTSKRNTPLLAVLACIFILCTAAHVTLAQDPIHVETSEVLIPAIVYDNERYLAYKRDGTDFWKAYFAGAEGFDSILETQGIVIRNLGTADFRVFEDGKEQPIRNVTYERTLYWNVRDSRGPHTEYMGPAGGKWSSAEWPPNFVGEIDPPYYLIAFVPPESPEGSCHQLKVRVNRPGAGVFARSEHCNTKHSASDPLSGTGLGREMERDLDSPKARDFSISLSAVAFKADSNAARVHVSLDWPSNSLNHSSRTIGILGLVLKKDGSPAMRFSDVFESAEGEGNFTGVYGGGPHFPQPLARYERQLVSSPGDYDLRVAVSDGTRFGRAEIPLTVEEYDKTKLAISDVSICKQVSNVFDYSPQHPATQPGAWTSKSPKAYIPLVSNDTEFKPTSNTRLKKGTTLYTYFQVYEPLLQPESRPTVQIRMRMLDLKTGNLISDSEPISAAPYVKSGNPVIPIGRGIDISKLPKGSYRLDVQASDSTGESTPWRSANFSVE